MRVRVVLQARMSSSRLTGKVLLPVSGIPLAVLCASRVMRDGLDLVLATSVERSDDILVDVLISNDINVYRGSLDDVLSRFVGAVKDLHDDDLVVRLTADNPFVDAEFVHALVDDFCNQDVDYLGTSSPLDALPYGLSAEVMTVGSVRQADENAISDFDREHVTPWIRSSVNQLSVGVSNVPSISIVSVVAWEIPLSIITVSKSVYELVFVVCVITSSSSPKNVKGISVKVAPLL